MSTQHTPGPWVGKPEPSVVKLPTCWALEKPAPPLWFVRDASPSGDVVALVNAAPPEVAAANARLIAAAPDLLAALSWVAGRVDDVLELEGERGRPWSADYFREVLYEIADHAHEAAGKAVAS